MLRSFKSDLIQDYLLHYSIAYNIDKKLKTTVPMNTSILILFSPGSQQVVGCESYSSCTACTTHRFSVFTRDNTPCKIPKYEFPYYLPENMPIHVKWPNAITHLAYQAFKHKQGKHC